MIIKYRGCEYTKEVKKLLKKKYGIKFKKFIDNFLDNGIDKIYFNSKYETIVIEFENKDNRILCTCTKKSL